MNDAELAQQLTAAQAGDERAFRRVVEPHRAELRAHCYRMSGSLHDADELVQEALLRAWRGLPAFAARSSLRTWLFRIATHVCLDELERRPARALPMDLSAPNGEMVGPVVEPIWLEPLPTPAATSSTKERVTFAFLTALQRLPPRQRAALILKDVVGYDAKEVAELLEMSAAAVNSALQRARASLDERNEPAGDDDVIGADDVDDHTRALLQRYVRAWESADVDALVSLLREDAVLQMPPLPAWLHGRDAIRASLLHMVLMPSMRARFLLKPTSANGLPAFAMFERDDRGTLVPRSIHVLEIERGAGAIRAVHAFLTPELVDAFVRV